MSDRRRNRVVISVVIAIIILILLLLLRCRRERESASPASGGSGMVVVRAGGGSGSAAAKRSKDAENGDGGGTGAASGGDVNGTVRLRAGAGGGEQSAGGGGGGGANPLPNGAGSNGELELVGELGAGGGKADPDRLATGSGSKAGSRVPFARSKLEGAIPAAWQDFSRDVRSRVQGDRARDPVPTSDGVDAQFSKQSSGNQWQFIDISIIDLRWKSASIPASTFEKAKASGGPVEYFRNENGDFLRASYFGDRPVQEDYTARGSDNKLTFMTGNRWQVFVRTRGLPDTVAGQIARQIDVALLDRLASELPPGTL